MNEYYRLANRYFRTFEDRKLYPTWRTWHWYAWTASLVALAFFAHHQIGLPAREVGGFSTFVMLAIDLCIVGTTVQISSYKERSILAAARAEHGHAFVSLDDCRTAVLENLLGTKAEKFASTAKECSELLALQRAHRLRNEYDLQDLARKVYDPDSKARLLAIFMGALALFVALMSKQLPEGSPTLLEILADGGVWQLVRFVVVVAAILFGVWMGVHAALVTGINATATWWVKLFGRSKRSRLALRYLMRDLVRLHMPGRMAQVVVPAAQPLAATSEAPQIELSGPALHQSPARQQGMALAAP
jgi:predicted Kef-type K+ transport protein